MGLSFNLVLDVVSMWVGVMRIVAIVGIIIATAVLPAQALEIEMLKPVVVAKIDKATQRMNVFVNGKQEYSWKVSTGRGRYDTPNGTHKPYRMHKMWYSRKYDMTPMPYSVFYKGGYAVHGTKALWRLGQPASHGCVRLSTKNAKIFYGLVKQHGRQRTQIAVSGKLKPTYVAARNKKKSHRLKRYASHNRPHRTRTSSYTTRQQVSYYSIRRRAGFSPQSQRTSYRRRGLFSFFR